MKTIELSDEDYKTLMGMSKELVTQDKDLQASPRFWSPRSTHKVQGNEDDDHIIYDPDAAETYTFEEYFETNDELAEEFIIEFFKEPGINFVSYEESIEMGWSEERDWRDFVLENTDCHVVYEKDEEKCDNNHSIFKSDVKNYIEGNKHHLGSNPHTYANTFHRMNKMAELVKILCNINGKWEDYK